MALSSDHADPLVGSAMSSERGIRMYSSAARTEAAGRRVTGSRAAMVATTRGMRNE
jgi:hypothetical protein